MSKSRNKRLYQENLSLKAMLREYKQLLHNVKINDECTVTKLSDEEMERQYREYYAEENNCIFSEETKERLAKSRLWI